MGHWIVFDMYVACVFSVCRQLNEILDLELNEYVILKIWLKIGCESRSLDRFWLYVLYVVCLCRQLIWISDPWIKHFFSKSIHWSIHIDLYQHYIPFPLHLIQSYMYILSNYLYFPEMSKQQCYHIREYKKKSTYRD